MKGLNIQILGENKTVNRQVLCGRERVNAHKDPEFVSNNRLSIDFTHIFDTPGKGSISKKDIEALIPGVMKAHRMLNENEGDIFEAIIRFPDFA